MDTRREKAALGLAVMALMAFAGCGGDAQSAADRESQPLMTLDAEVSEPELAEVPSLQPAPAPPAPAPARSAPAPSRAPAAPAPRPVVEPMAQPSAPVEREVRALAAGRTLDLTMESGLSTESAEVGESFYATVSEDILGSGGEVLLPIGARVTGHVSESRRSERAGEPAVLGLEFTSVMVSGVRRPLQATIVEVVMTADERASNSATAAKIGVGAAAGAVLGRIIGRDTGGSVRGAVVGAAAGTAVALATKGGHAVIEPGARVVIRLDERLILDY